MNLKPYINFLLDNHPAPFCEYIIDKELLKAHEQTVQNSYEWAVRFNLYTEMKDEQFPDGSWGDFYPMDTSPAVRKKHKITDRSTIRRLKDLSLGTDDEMVAKTLRLCRNIINDNFPMDKYARDRITHKRNAYQVLYDFCPDDPLVAEMKAEKYLNDEKQRAYIIYEWDHGPFDMVKLSDRILPDDNRFVFWMCGLEDAAHYKYFGAFMADETIPFLLSLCERLVNPKDSLKILTNRYYSKVGQYSEEWKNNEVKKRDVLLRVLRIINKC